MTYYSDILINILFSGYRSKSLSEDQLLSDNNPRGEKFRELITLPKFESILYTL